jgi:hypothetical protein
MNATRVLVPVALLVACTKTLPAPSSDVPSASAETAASTSVAPPPPPASVAAVRDAGAPAKYPVRSTKAMKLDGIDDVAAARQAPVMSDGASIELSEYPGDGKRTVRTCDEYDKAIADHFGPQTTFDISRASFFVARCTPLRFLAEATGSAASWVSDLRLDKDPLGVLPGTMNLGLAAPTDEDKAAFAKGMRLEAFDPKLVVERSSATSVTFGVPKVDTSTVDIVAFGDFDHDGIEDVLLLQAHHSLQGSFRSYRHFIATRKGPKDPLTVVRELP